MIFGNNYDNTPAKLKLTRLPRILGEIPYRKKNTVKVCTL